MKHALELPWRNDGLNIIDDVDEVIAHAFSNIELLTAAPELLEELQKVTDELVMQIALRFNDTNFDAIRNENPIVKSAIAAITKARELL
jgi:hypothetical protein